jgi:hypothetical protein
MERVLLGAIGVDSGNVIVGDPCYAIRVDPENPIETGYYCVVNRTAFGDGIYNVFADIGKDGLIRRLVVDMYYPGDSDNVKVPGGSQVQEQ